VKRTTLVPVRMRGRRRAAACTEAGERRRFSAVMIGPAPRAQPTASQERRRASRREAVAARPSREEARREIRGSREPGPVTSTPAATAMSTVARKVEAGRSTTTGRGVRPSVQRLQAIVPQRSGRQTVPEPLIVRALLTVRAPRGAVIRLDSWIATRLHAATGRRAHATTAAYRNRVAAAGAAAAAPIGRAAAASEVVADDVDDLYFVVTGSFSGRRSRPTSFQFPPS
jgi:hypothetical protein